MLSHSIPSPQKVLPLSYADHAKKAQNIRSPISPHPSPILAHSVHSTSGSPSKLLSNLPAVDAKSDVIDHVTPTDSSDDTLKPINGDTRASNALLAKALSVVAAHTSSQKIPVANVWNIRKEQLAAARAALIKALEKESPQESQEVSTSSEPPSPQNTAPSVCLTSSSAPNTSHDLSRTLNGVTSTRQDDKHDPFIIRTIVKTRSTNPPPPPVDDADSWPEVGKAAVSTHSAANTTAVHLDNATRNKPENDQIPARKSAFYPFISFILRFASSLNIVHLSLFLCHVDASY